MLRGGNLLAGLLFGVGYRAGSFGGAKPLGLAQSIYFSFVTLATLGYGDITPVTALAGTLASLEAIAGQLYIGITVARLVALSLTDHADPRQRSKL
jgi:hypothetical protein